MTRWLAVGCLVISSSARAGEEPLRHGFWGTLDIGVGTVHLAPDSAAADTDTRLYLGAAGGYTVHSQVQLGLEMSGWNIESGNLWDLGDNNGLSTLLVVARLWPSAASRLYFKIGSGDVIHGSTRAGGVGVGSGHTLGIGYTWLRYATTETSAFLNYSAGRVDDYTPPGSSAQDEQHRIVTVGLSFAF